jgi:hypothetical protein
MTARRVVTGAALAAALLFLCAVPAAAQAPQQMQIDVNGIGRAS